MKVLVPLLLALGIATPASALEAIGEIGAKLDGEELNWQVLRQDDGSAMVQITEPPRVCRRLVGLSHAAMAGSLIMA